MTRQRRPDQRDVLGVIVIVTALAIAAVGFRSHPDLTTIIRYPDRPATEEGAR